MKSDLGEYQLAMDRNSKVSKSLKSLEVVTQNNYHESGLVLSANDILFSLMKFSLDPIIYDLKLVQAKGKGTREHPYKEYGTRLAKKCFQSRNYQLALRVSQLVLEYEVLTPSGPSKEILEISADCLSQLLETLLISRYSDYQLCFGYMLSVTKEKANALFKDSIALMAKDYPRLQRIARIGAMAGSVWNQRNFQVNCLDLIQHSRWLQELKLLEIPCDDNTLRNTGNAGGEQVRKLVPYLLLKTHGDLATVIEFAQQYRIEGNMYAHFR